jgi:hypothetical protein
MLLVILIQCYEKEPFKKEKEIKPKWTSTPFKNWTGMP